MDKMEILRGVDVFAGLQTDQLEKLSAVCQEVEYDLDEVVFNERSPGQHLFVVVTGVVEIYREVDGDDRHVRLARLGPGELFGELSVADGEPRSASARATIDPQAKLLCIAKSHLDKLLDENPAMALTYHKGLVRKLTERLRKVDDAVHDFSRRLQQTWY
ncbi:MAG: Crp/Fnr family transcriptional regulator [Planctomycetota bacterium]|jgi:CRP-like cAMP-binding protein